MNSNFSWILDEPSAYFIEVIKLFRLKQWIKNGFVAMAVIFSGDLFKLESVLLTIQAMIIFSLTSSSVYIINDIMDIKEDRIHPKKRFRPIAKGSVSIVQAKILFMVLLIASGLWAMVINRGLFLILAAYILTNLCYNYFLKKIIILDVMTIALGFILRVYAGAMVVGVALSSWLIICTGLLSLYLGFAKRKNELVILTISAANHRSTLSQYNLEFLDKILSLTSGLAITTYILYTINGTDNKGMIFTIPFVLYGMMRYEYLIIKENIGGSPEELFLDDKPFLINIFLWVMTAVISIYLE